MEGRTNGKVSENGELRGIFGHARDKVTLEWKWWLRDLSVGALVVEMFL